MLDPHWSTLPASTKGYHTFRYRSEVEFILIKTDSEVEFRRILPINTEALPGGIKWDDRSGEQYYILRVDPAQKLIVAGNPTVRFFRCPKEEEKAPVTGTPESKAQICVPEKSVRPWEAEDAYQKRDVVMDEKIPSEDLAEASRRFKAWRAETTDSLFVYLVAPKKLNEGEWIQLLDNGVQFFDDVPWVL